MLVQDGESSFWQNGRRELNESYLLFRMIFSFLVEKEKEKSFSIQELMVWLLLKEPQRRQVRHPQHLWNLIWIWALISKATADDSSEHFSRPAALPQSPAQETFILVFPQATSSPKARQTGILTGTTARKWILSQPCCNADLMVWF